MEKNKGPGKKIPVKELSDNARDAGERMGKRIGENLKIKIK